MEELLKYLVFGIADNGIVLIGMVFGIALPGEKAKNAIIGALVGNAIGDGIAGLLALDIKLAVGTFVGCLIPLLIYRIFKK